MGCCLTYYCYCNGDGDGQREDCQAAGASVCGDILGTPTPPCTADCNPDKCCQGTTTDTTTTTPTTSTTTTTTTTSETTSTTAPATGTTTPGRLSTPGPKDCYEVCKQTEGRVDV